MQRVLSKVRKTRGASSVIPTTKTFSLRYVERVRGGRRRTRTRVMRRTRKRGSQKVKIVPRCMKSAKFVNRSATRP